MSHEPKPVYFTDENALGLGKLLHLDGREDVLFPGHASLPEVPLGTPDLEWMPSVARRGLIVMTRERRIRTRPIELAAYRRHGIRSIRIGSKRDQSPAEQREMFMRHEHRIIEEISRLGDGPWALVLTASGVREITLRSAD
jgi:hypothetical protein